MCPTIRSTSIPGLVEHPADLRAASASRSSSSAAQSKAKRTCTLTCSVLRQGPVRQLRARRPRPRPPGRPAVASWRAASARRAGRGPTVAAGVSASAAGATVVSTSPRDAPSAGILARRPERLDLLPEPRPRSPSSVRLLRRERAAQPSRPAAPRRPCQYALQRAGSHAAMCLPAPNCIIPWPCTQRSGTARRQPEAAVMDQAPGRRSAPVTSPVRLRRRAAWSRPAPAASHRGHVRERNEDAILTDPTGALWAVADGMGGHGHGDLAADLVIDAFARLPHGRGGRSLLQDAFAAAHAEVRRRARADGLGADRRDRGRAADRGRPRRPSPGPATAAATSARAGGSSS